MSAAPKTSHADNPWSMGWQAWKSAVLRSWAEAIKDNIGLVAAGVAFYGFLALIPLLGAIVLSYGLIAKPEAALSNMRHLSSIMPANAAKLLSEQLLNVVKTSNGDKIVGLLVALGFALFGSRNGASALITALNIAYEKKEERGFVRLNLLTLTVTCAAVGMVVTATIAIGALGILQATVPRQPGWLAIIERVGMNAALVAAAAAAAATLYRYGPSRQRARWIWITPGSVFTAIAWLVLSLGLGPYVANVGHFDTTYGSLGTVVALLTWIYLATYALLYGAELNAEFERQTAQNTTTGRRSSH